VVSLRMSAAACMLALHPAPELWLSTMAQVTTLTWPNKGHWKWDFAMGMLSKEQKIIADRQHICFDDLYVGRCGARPASLEQGSCVWLPNMDQMS
jgi:hypothetical protein